MVTRRLLLTCEHASNRVPREYRRAFSSKSAERALASHQGYDLGAAAVARYLSRETGAECLNGKMSRLLVDLNRSGHNPRRFSPFSFALTAEERQKLDRHRDDHELCVERRIRSLRAPVVHLGVHSFTPELSGESRAFDVGVLYDPRRKAEKAFADRFISALKEGGDVLTRRNAPYRGVADGLTTCLRRRFSPRDYIGIELELNQALLLPRCPRWLLRRLLLAVNRATSG